MADSGSISDGSLGFFTKTGEVKSKQQEAATLSKLNKAELTASEDPAPSQGTDNATKFSEAISSIEERVNTSVSRVASAINIDSANLKSARKQVKDEISNLRDMRAALDDGSKADYGKLRDQYEKLQEKRTELRVQIASDNKEIENDRVVGVRLGNRTEATFELKAPTLSEESSATDLKDKKQLTKLIKEKEAELEDLRVQTKVVKAQKKSLTEVSTKLTDEIRGVESRTLKSFDEASSLSKKIAGAISSGGAELFEKASLSNLRTAVGLKLIS